MANGNIKGGRLTSAGQLKHSKNGISKANKQEIYHSDNGAGRLNNWITSWFYGAIWNVTIVINCNIGRDFISKWVILWPVFVDNYGNQRIIITHCMSYPHKLQKFLITLLDVMDDSHGIGTYFETFAIFFYIFYLLSSEHIWSSDVMECTHFTICMFNL